MKEHNQPVLPDLRARYVQFQMHEMSIPSFVESAVDSDWSQEWVLRIKGPKK